MNRRCKIGLLVPSSDTVIEGDLWRRLPAHVLLHVARMYLSETTVIGEERMLKEELAPAARRVASAEPELIVFGCTSAAALHGLEGDQALSDRIKGIAGCPTITVMQAAVCEIEKLNCSRLFLFTPYVEKLTERLENTLTEAGLPVVGADGLGLDQDLAIAAVSPEEIGKAVIKAASHNRPRPDAIFISCTTFRAFDALGIVEGELGIPVVTSNQAAFQYILDYLDMEVRT